MNPLQIDGLRHLWSELKKKFAAIDHSHDVATASSAGLLSATDKSKLDSAIVGFSVSGNVITFTRANGSTERVTIPVATTTTAGVMSAADKQQLDNFWGDESQYDDMT